MGKKNEAVNLMSLGQSERNPTEFNMLLQLNGVEIDQHIELDDAGMLTILEKLIEIKGKDEIRRWIDECLDDDESFDESEYVIDGDGE